MADSVLLIFHKFFIIKEGKNGVREKICKREKIASYKVNKNFKKHLSRL